MEETLLKTREDLKKGQRDYSTLIPFFKPKNVAVIGATEKPNSVGRTMLWNLISNPFGGTVYPVNPNRQSVLGVKTYPNIKSIPEEVDLAVIITPANTVPDIVGECVEAGVNSAIIISAGFKELGPSGVALEQQITEKANKGKMRIIGPNCLGVMDPHTGLNATFANEMAYKGNIAFISQSGALGTAVLDWSLRERVGFSSFISIGSMLDVGWGDLIDYLGGEPHTKGILIYIETIGDARSFFSAAREVALTKPIIILKAGCTEAAARAAVSHTGSLTGRDEVLDAAFQRSGVLRVNKISELFYMAELLAKQPKPTGPKLTIVTNAGGPGILATDSLIASGGELAELSKKAMLDLNQILPEHWSRNNPIDILGDADHKRYADTIEIVADDPSSDGLLVILTPQAMTNPTLTAERLKPFSNKYNKPILTSWMGGIDVQAGRDILNRAGIPDFGYPDTAATMFSYMWKYSSNLRSLYETPSLLASFKEYNRKLAEEIISSARKSNRIFLNEYESKLILKSYGIQTVETHIATSEEEAVKTAEKIGYPVVLKLLSDKVTHKTDVGGVKLDLKDSLSVREAYQLIKSSIFTKYDESHFMGVTVQSMIKVTGYELIVGSTIDPQIGPVILFGAGGELVEILKDIALGLPPLNANLANIIIKKTNIYSALKGTRGKKPVDVKLLEELLVHFSQLIIEQPWIKEIDINPLLASSCGLIALDARIVLHGNDIKENDLPQLTIRPYPKEYTSSWILKNGTSVTIRPIRPEDELQVVRFHETLSKDSIISRYFHFMKLDYRTSHNRMVRVCYNDYDREIGLVVEQENSLSQSKDIIAIGRLIRVNTDEAEFAIIVSDPYQKQGLGTHLLELLLEVGKKEKYKSIKGYLLPENMKMRSVCERLGFKLSHKLSERMIIAEFKYKQMDYLTSKL